MWAIFDLDGTLCDTSHRDHLVQGKDRDWDRFNALCPLDPPRPAEVALARSWLKAGNQLAILTGRTAGYWEVTRHWLYDHGIHYHMLGMRPNGDFRPSEVFKREWYEDFVKLVGEQALFTVEDRDKMVKFWRDLGVTCFQCQPGAY